MSASFINTFPQSHIFFNCFCEVLNNFFLSFRIFFKTGFFEYNTACVDEDSVLLTHDAVLVRNRFSMFRDNALVTSLRVESCKKNAGDSWMVITKKINPLNPELNPICYLLALLGAHYFLHVSRIRVKSLTFRLLMSYIYKEHPFLIFLDHTQRRTTVGRTPLDE